MYILTNGIVAVGPFTSIEDAEKYRDVYNMRHSFKTMELMSPTDVKGWKVK